jgi:hypothetical protein
VWGISHLPFSAVSGRREAVSLWRGTEQQGRHGHVASRGAPCEEQRSLAQYGEARTC